MTDFIDAPVAFDSEDKKVIRDSFKKHKDWEKSCFDKIKSKTIKHLRIKQKNRCCYCKWELGFDIKEVDIEHIIPKSEYEKFTFHPKNLALSCPGCNTNKGKRCVLYTPIENYPRSGRNITIVHAHFDKYSEHIEIYDEAIYEGRSDKGCETIKLCKLYRLKEVIKKIRESKKKSSPIADLVSSLKEASDTEKNDLLNELKSLTNNFKGT